MWRIGHFRVPPSLCFKTRIGTHPLIWKSFFILKQIILIFTRKVVHVASFWKWGSLELGSGLLKSESVPSSSGPFARRAANTEPHITWHQPCVLHWEVIQDYMNSITIHANSPEYGTDLLLSRTGHHISRIKSSLELVCALAWDLVHF